jgi:predicted permease
VTAALPTAQNIFNFASRYDRGVAVARDTALVTTIAAVPVLIAVSLLLG